MAREINVARLMTLAKYLLTVKEEKFDLSGWGAHDGVVDVNDQKVLGIKDLQGVNQQTVCPTNDQLNNTCGTTACALGHAATMPEFQKLGLTLEFDCHGSVDWFRKNANTVAVEDAHVRLRQKGKRTQTDFDAGAHFFGLSKKESQQLFNPMGYEHLDIDLRELRPIHVVGQIAVILWNRGLIKEAQKIMNMPQVKKENIVGLSLINR